MFRVVVLLAVCLPAMSQPRNESLDELFGQFYEERGRRRELMATPDEGWQRAKDVVLRQQWNHYEILAEGDRVRLILNGKVTFDGTDDNTGSGIIAIQLHRGPAMQIECRNIRIKEL